MRRLLLSAAALAALVCLLILPAGAADTGVEPLLRQVSLTHVFGSETFTLDEVEFQRIIVPAYVLEVYDTDDYAIHPGERDEKVRELKRYLYSNDNFPYNEYVTYSQADIKRDMVADYFDDHLALLIEVLYQFCGLEDREPCIDPLTVYLFHQLEDLDKDMRNDIEVVYKYRMIQEDTVGTISRSGEPDGMYYYAQTDPDWADKEFAFEGNGATLRDRGCGTACMSMVFSTYHMVEINPYWAADYAQDGNWQVSYGLPNEFFLGIAEKYARLETERYGTYLYQPQIIKKADVDMDTLADQIGNQGYMAIIHVVAGAFTSQEHYMVLADYEVIDGVGYFLVADPYIMPERYSSRDQLKDVPGDNEGLIYATSSLLYRDMKSIILFAQDREAFPLGCKSAAPVRIDHD